MSKTTDAIRLLRTLIYAGRPAEQVARCKRCHNFSRKVPSVFSTFRPNFLKNTRFLWLWNQPKVRTLLAI